MSTTKRSPTKEEKWLIIGLVLQIAVKQTLQNHCYEHNGEIYHQSNKGVIGLDLMRNMKNSGHDEKFRRDVLISEINGYNKQLQDDTEGIKPLYRPWEWDRANIDKAKVEKLSNWYCKGADQKEVLFIPSTPGSVLKNILEESIKPFNDNLKIRIVENPGDKLSDVSRKEQHKMILWLQYMYDVQP